MFRPSQDGDAPTRGRPCTGPEPGRLAGRKPLGREIRHPLSLGSSGYGPAGPALNHVFSGIRVYSNPTWNFEYTTKLSNVMLAEPYSVVPSQE